MARGYTDAEVDPECLQVLQETAALCADLGHTVEPVEPIYERDAVVMTFLAIMAVNMDANLAANPVLERPAREDEVEPITWGCAELGRRLGGADLVRALQTAHRLGREMAAVHAEYDLLLTPGLARPAVELGHLDMQMSDLNLYWRRVFDFSPFTVLFNLTGQPACMLPLGQSADGLPIAVQIAGPYGDEETVLALAAQLEQARPWRDRRPELA